WIRNRLPGPSSRRRALRGELRRGEQDGRRARRHHHRNMVCEGISKDVTEKRNQALKSKQLIDEQPWLRPWWQYSDGNGAVLLYIVAIHSLALAGLVLFPLPSLRVAAMAVAVAWIGGVGTTVCYHRCLSHRALRL